jgi:hypothetical protein
VVSSDGDDGEERARGPRGPGLAGDSSDLLDLVRSAEEHARLRPSEPEREEDVVEVGDEALDAPPSGGREAAPAPPSGETAPDTKPSPADPLQRSGSRPRPRLPPQIRTTPANTPTAPIAPSGLPPAIGILLVFALAIAALAVVAR